MVCPCANCIDCCIMHQLQWHRTGPDLVSAWHGGIYIVACMLLLHLIYYSCFKLHCVCVRACVRACVCIWTYYYACVLRVSLASQTVPKRPGPEGEEEKGPSPPRLRRLLLGTVQLARLIARLQPFRTQGGASLVPRPTSPPIIYPDVIGDISIKNWRGCGSGCGTRDEPGEHKKLTCMHPEWSRRGVNDGSAFHSVLL